MTDYIFIGLSVILSAFSLYIYLSRYIEVIRVKKYYKVFIICLGMISTFPLLNFEGMEAFYGLRALLVLMASFVCMYFIFSTTIAKKLFILLNYYLYIFTGFLFFSSIIINASGKTLSLLEVNKVPQYNIAYIFSYVLAIIVFLILDKVVIKNKILVFIKQRRAFYSLIIMQSILILSAVFLIREKEISIYLKWFNESIITSSIAIYVTNIMILILSVNIAYLSEYKFYNRQLKTQLDYQLTHYKKYEMYMSSFAKFKHDYDKINSAILKLDVTKDYNKIKEILNESNKEIEGITKLYKRYSNNYIIDALFNEYASKFNTLGIEFKDTFLPFNIEMLDYDIIKLFYNIMQNAYEALLKVDKHNRCLTVNTYKVKNFQIFEFKNSSDNSKHKFKTSKYNKILHGHGLTIIEEVTQKYGGIIEKEIIKDDDQYVFVLKIYLPLK